MTRKAPAHLARRHPTRIPVDDEVELRVLEETHARALFALMDENRDYLRMWLNWVDETRSVKDTAKFIRGGRAQLRRNDGFQLGIWYRGELVGAVGYHYWNWIGRKTELGYWLAASFQGRGIMTRACGALVDYAFGNLDLNRVEIRAATGNRRSRAVAERLGFRHEGVLRDAEYSSGGVVDQAVYGLLRRDWPSRP